MKATKRIGLIACAAGILLTGTVIAQGAAATDSTDSSGTTSASSTASSSTDTSPQASQLVAVIESDGDLDEVAEAIYLTGTDALVSTMPDGVTIFAPVDGSFGQGVVVEDVITSYIIPGIVDTSNMTADSTTTSTAISGDPVTIAVVDEVVTVNGVPVMDSQAIYTDNAVIYKLSDSFASSDLAANK